MNFNLRAFLIVPVSTLLVFGTSACSVAPVELTTHASASINSFEEVLGTLIVFASFMLVLAVGTEALIDVVKVATGFKSKPTALDTIKKLREWLPEQVKAVNGDESKSTQLLKSLDRLEKVVGDAEQGALAVSASREWVEGSIKALDEGKISGIFGLNLAGLESAMKTAGVEQTRIDEVKSWLQGSLSALKARTVQDLLGRFNLLVNSLSGLSDKQKKQIVTIVQLWLTEIVPDLTMLKANGTFSVEDFLKGKINTLLAGLEKLQLDASTRKKVADWISGTIYSIDVVTNDAYLAAITQLVQTVEKRREHIQSPIRNFWRWIKMRFLGLDIQLRPDRVILPISAENLASILAERDDFHRDEEVKRLRWLRVVSVVVGILLAVFLQVDVGYLLGPLISSEYVKLLTAHFNGWIKMLSIGILLSSLAASAGATFWHDVLDKLQASKKVVEDTGDLLKKLRDLEMGK